MFLLWIVLTGGAVWALVRAFQGPEVSLFSPKTHQGPLEALQHRYATGEISTEEYEKRKERLERDP